MMEIILLFVIILTILVLLLNIHIAKMMQSIKSAKTLLDEIRILQEKKDERDEISFLSGLVYTFNQFKEDEAYEDAARVKALIDKMIKTKRETKYY